MRIKQSVCYPMYKNFGIEIEHLRTFAEIGYKAVEFWYRDEEFDRLCDEARTCGLVVSQMAGHGTLEDALNNPANHARIEDELKESIDVAAERGIPGLICFSGNRRNGQSDAEAIDAVAEGFRRIAPYAEQKGINLNLELLNSKVDHPGYQCDHTAWGVEVCRRVNSPRVKLLYDIYHMQIMEGDIIRAIQENIEWIGHFHTAGNPGRHEMDDTQEIHYPGICRAIAATDYDLYLAHEFRPRGDLIESLRQAFELCDQG